MKRHTAKRVLEKAVCMYAQATLEAVGTDTYRVIMTNVADPHITEIAPIYLFAMESESDALEFLGDLRSGTLDALRLHVAEQIAHWDNKPVQEVYTALASYEDTLIEYATRDETPYVTAEVIHTMMGGEYPDAVIRAMEEVRKYCPRACVLCVTTAGGIFFMDARCNKVSLSKEVDMSLIQAVFDAVIAPKMFEYKV